MIIRSSGFQLCVESNFAIALGLHCYALCLAKTFSQPIGSKTKSNHAHTLVFPRLARFPALVIGQSEFKLLYLENRLRYPLIEMQPVNSTVQQLTHQGQNSMQCNSNQVASAEKCTRASY